MLPGVLVELSGPTMRQDETNDGGQVGFSQLQAGTYRLRFSGDAVTTFEREVTLTSGKSTPLDISLSPAPPPREIIKEVAAPLPPEPKQVVGPPGAAQLLSLYDLAEEEIESKAPRREVLVACSGNLRSSMVTLIREEQPKRMYQGAEVLYYVLGGEAAVNVNGKETNLPPGGYVAVPRGTPFSITAKGKKALSLLSVLSGEPCEQASSQEPGHGRTRRRHRRHSHLPRCGRPNRLAFASLGKTARCGNCKASVGPVAVPVEITDAAHFDAASNTSTLAADRGLLGAVVRPLPHGGS